MAMDRKTLRREMFNAGLFTQLGLLLSYADPDIKMIICLILRLSIQPLNEKTVQPPNVTNLSCDASSSQLLACGTRLTKSEKVINITLHKMRPTSASISQNGFERLKSAEQDASNIKSSALPPSPPTPPTSTLHHQLPNENKWVKPLMPGWAINRRCLELAVAECAAHLIRDLFAQSLRLKRYSLLFLHDIVKLTDSEEHMQLSKLGVIPKLLDFIRINEDKEHLEITALKVLARLVLSDDRLRQLFFRYNGITVLITLTRCPNITIQQVARTTLITINKADRCGMAMRTSNTVKRPASAPLGIRKREKTLMDIVSQPKDIWNHIMQRWSEEDKVVAVLKQFM